MTASHLVSGSDEEHLPPSVGIGDAAEVALLEAEVWQGREAALPRRRPEDAVGDVVLVVVVDGVVVMVRRRDLEGHGLYLLGGGRGPEVELWIWICPDVGRLDGRGHLARDGRHGWRARGSARPLSVVLVCARRLGTGFVDGPPRWERWDEVRRLAGARSLSARRL